MSENSIVTCEECGTNRRKWNTYELELYDTPWNEVPRIAYFCKNIPDSMYKKYDSIRYYDSCVDLLMDTSLSDFRYFTCEICQRLVCYQNPRNGWHSQVRIINECEEVCLKCYEETILENGIDRDSFVNRQIKGMFFSYGNTKLTEAGYKLIIDNTFIHSQESVDNYCRTVIDLIDSGHKVVTGYGHLGLGGSEGYVSLFAKKEV